MSAHGVALAREFCPDLDGARLEAQLDRNHGGKVAGWARKSGLSPVAILDFSASINPLGPPASARQAFLKSFGDISHYPDSYGWELKQALAVRHGMDPAEILLGNGSTQLIYLLCAALRPRKGMIVAPAFSEYANALMLASAAVQFLPLCAEEGFELSIERLIDTWEKDCDMIFLATPNSFTGRLVPRREIAQLANLARAKKTLLVVDEAFIDFAEEESVKALVHQNPYLILLRSLTKFYSLPGLRIGYLLAEDKRIRQLAAYQEPWAVNTPASRVACACLNDSHFTPNTVRWLARERHFLATRLARILRVFPSKANFLLACIEKEVGDAFELSGFLSRRGILIRTCGSLAGLDKRYFRVAVRRRQDNLRLITALEEWTSLSKT